MYIQFIWKVYAWLNVNTITNLFICNDIERIIEMERKCKNKKGQKTLKDDYKYAYCEACHNSHVEKTKKGMMKNENIIKFYMLTECLKTKLRTGWLDISVQNDRIESIAEHIYGTLMLAVAIASEYDLDIDMNKVYKMLILHELEETLIPDYTIRSGITKEQKLLEGKKAVHEATEGLIKQAEIEDLLDEFNAHETKESRFAYQIDKLECDFQCKKYDLDGALTMENLRKDASNSGPRRDEIYENAKNPSDIWIEVDRPIYKDDIFISLLEDIKKYDTEERL